MNERDTFTELAQKYLDGMCSEMELATFEALLAQESHAADALAHAARLDEGLTRIFRTEARRAVALAQLSAPRQAPSWNRTMRIAGWALAAMLVVAFAIPILRRFNGVGSVRQHSGLSDVGSGQLISGAVRVDGSSVQTPRDGSSFQVVGDKPAIIRVTDGSEAQLQPGSRARFRGPRSGPWEAMELSQGSAQFHMQKGDGRFQVETQFGPVTAFATDFSVTIQSGHPSPAQVNNDSARLAVDVQNGVVQVDNCGNSYVLGRGENRVFFDRQHNPESQAHTNAPSVPAHVLLAHGSIVSVSSKTIVLAGHGESTFILGPDVTVTLDGKPGRIEDLAGGMIVSLQRGGENDPVTAIRVEGPTIGGEVRSVDTDNSTITIVRTDRRDGAEQTLPYTQDTVITMDGQPANVSDLHSGIAVVLRLTMDKKTIAAVIRSGRGHAARPLAGRGSSSRQSVTRPSTKPQPDEKHGRIHPDY